MTTIAARFRRVSSELQRDNTSLENQLSNIDRYCLEHGYETPHDLLFTEVMTGVEFWDMPELQRLLAKAPEGAFQVVVVDHTDRMVRGEILVAIMSQLARYNIRLESVKQNIEDTPEGKLVLLVTSWGSKREWDRIKQRTSEGRDNYVRKQKKILGTDAGYGYKKVDGHYIYNDDVMYTDRNGTEWTERTVVEWCFQKCKEGMTLYTITQTLTDMGIPTRRDGRWNQYFVTQILHDEGYEAQRADPNNQPVIARIRQLAAEGMTPSAIAKLLNEEGITQHIIPQVWRTSTVFTMLRNQTYIGNFYAFRRSYTRRSDGWDVQEKPVEEQVLLEGTVPPIINEITFNLVQRQLASNKERSPRNLKHPESALMRRRCRCAYCGGHMNTRNRDEDGTGLYFCIAGVGKHGKCKPLNTVAFQIVDAAAWEYACEIIRDPKKLKESIEALRTPDPTAEGGKPIAIRKKELEEELDNLLEMGRTAENKRALEKIQGWIKNAEAGLAEIEEKEKILQGIRRHWEKAQEEIYLFELWCAEWVEKLEKATFQNKLYCIEYLGIEVIVYRYGSRPRLTMTVSPPDLMKKFAALEKNGMINSIRTVV